MSPLPLMASPNGDSALMGVVTTTAVPAEVVAQVRAAEGTTNAGSFIYQALHTSLPGTLDTRTNREAGLDPATTPMIPLAQVCETMVKVLSAPRDAAVGPLISIEAALAARVEEAP